MDLNEALARKRESKYLEFKKGFDPSERAEWCEIIKDIIAIINSGGGWILFGLTSGGRPTGSPVQPILALDPADVQDQIHRFTGSHFSDFELLAGRKDGHAVAALRLAGSDLPLVFESHGNYAVPNGKQKSAFSKGTVYFRHGAKSEPGTSADLREAVDRRIAEMRKAWMDGLRKVVEAPHDALVAVLPSEVVQSADPAAIAIRLTDADDAPVYRMVDPDQAYPYRQKELIEEFNQRIGTPVVNAHDILSVRRVHGIDGDPRYYHSSKWSSPQYSEQFLEWLLEHYRKSPKFFQAARREYGHMLEQR